MTENIKYFEDEKKFYGNNFKISLSPEPREDGKEWAPLIVLTTYGPGQVTEERIPHPDGLRCNYKEEAYKVSKTMAEGIIIERKLS